MKTTAVRMYGQNDLRLETFELPPIQDDEILVKIISDSICMSSYKAAIQGTNHKRVPKDIATNPIIIGHEFCGEIVEVGAKHADKFKPGQKFGMQPALNYKGRMGTPGYAYTKLGGDATYAIMAPEVMEMNCLLDYHADAFFYGSLAEPLSCIVGAFNAQYHTEGGSYEHLMDVREGGLMAILAGAGPMGLGMIDYAIHRPRRPSKLVVTDIDQARLDRAASIYTVEDAKAHGVELTYLNTREQGDEKLMAISGGAGFDDVFVLAPVAAVIEQGDRILGRDGCLNFFAGPTNPKLTAQFNFYNVHYASTHIVGTSGGNTSDMIEALGMIGSGELNPAGMVTHIGGLDAAAEATMNLPKIPGGKKLIYTHVSLPLTAIDDFGKLGETDPLFAELHKLCSKHNGLWCAEAERYLLAHAPEIKA